MKPIIPAYRRAWVHQFIARCGRAWRYALGTWTEDDASRIAWEAHPVAGYAVLETVDVEGTVEWAAEHYGDHPRMEEWARQAVSRVGHKWESTGDAAGAAQDWAVDLIREYAASEGVTLTAAD